MSDTGASQFGTEAFAATIERAVSMSADERRRRMEQLRRQVDQSTAYRWVEDQLSALGELEQSPVTEGARA